MNHQLRRLLHQSLSGDPSRRAGQLLKKAPAPVRDTAPAPPTTRQKKARRRAQKQARRRG